MPNADAYQMLAYCIALGLRRGYLIYAKESGAGNHRHRVVRHGYEIEVRAVDVELEPEQLLTQVDGLADAVARDWAREAEWAA
jgi:5-methylcytosine-specific restriction enzyme subunit McrC